MFDIHQAITRNDEVDEGLVGRYIEGLMAEFAKSDEAKPVIDAQGQLDYAAMMMGYAIDYLGSTPPEMSLHDFNEVVFQIFPRKVSMEPEKAPEVITELKAFWTFLRRHYGLKNADAILASLTDDSVLRLRSALANPRNYGMAKSFFMAGKEAGFDMTTQQGLDAFMAVYNSGLPSRPAPPVLPLESRGDFQDRITTLPPSDSAFMTPKQCAEKRRQARKKNRRK